MKLIAKSVTEDEHVFDRGLAEAVAKWDGMAGGKYILYHGSADESGRTGNEYMHDILLVGLMSTIDGLRIRVK